MDRDTAKYDAQETTDQDRHAPIANNNGTDIELPDSPNYLVTSSDLKDESLAGRNAQATSNEDVTASTAQNDDNGAFVEATSHPAQSQVAFDRDQNAEAAATPAPILLGVPIARHDNIHNKIPLDRSDSTGGNSLDASSSDEGGALFQDAIDGQQPYQEAQLAEEQNLEPDVRRIPSPQPRRRKRRVSRSVGTKYVCCRSSTAIPRWAAIRG